MTGNKIFVQVIKESSPHHPQAKNKKTVLKSTYLQLSVTEDGLATAPYRQ